MTDNPSAVRRIPVPDSMRNAAVNDDGLLDNDTHLVLASDYDATVSALQRELATERAARLSLELKVATVRTKYEFLLDAVINAGYEFLIPEERA